MTNPKRRMTMARSYKTEADYYEFEILPTIHYGDIYRARLKHMIATRRDKALQLEAQVYAILRDEE